MSERPIEVLVVDDSAVMRMLLVHLVESDPHLHVAGALDCGPAALAFIERQAPDVVLMDINMDGMDGFEVSRLIMETRPLPIVMCSAVRDPGEVATAFRAFEAGAVAVVAKPVASDQPEFARLSAELLQTVRLMSEVKVVRRWPRKRGRTDATAARTGIANFRCRNGVVAIGASTGGPPALQTILAGLPKDFPFPVLVVQHISAGFLPGLAEWLNQTTPLHVQIAGHAVEAQPGHVYLAPDDFHMGIGAQGEICLDRRPSENALRPSVDHLFRSVAQHCAQEAIGVLLTGMGKDGAAAMKAMHDRGARTIAQDRQTSIVYGMPGSAVLLKAVDEVLPLGRIAAAICRAAQELMDPKVKP